MLGRECCLSFDIAKETRKNVVGIMRGCVFSERLRI